MAGDANPYTVTLNEIKTRITSLEVGAPASSSEGSWSAQEVDATLASLRTDAATLSDHAGRAVQTVAHDAPEACAACGQPRPCRTARDLFTKYAD